MPIHDWSRVDANLFHDFRQTWSINIRNALNGGLLPPGFAALVEQHAGGLVPDVIALEFGPRLNQPSQLEGGGVITAAPPRTKYVMRSDAEVSAERGNRIVIHHPLGEVVCIIEIVSPGNKSGKAALRRFVENTIEFIRAGVNVLVIDLFPPTVRDPQGIHKAIWDEIEEQPFTLPPNKPLTLAAYVAEEVKTAYVEPVGVGDSLMDMPAWLDRKSYVPVPLEATYQTTWASCPLMMREAVEQARP